MRAVPPLAQEPVVEAGAVRLLAGSSVVDTEFYQDGRLAVLLQRQSPGAGTSAGASLMLVPLHEVPQALSAEQRGGDILKVSPQQRSAHCSLRRNLDTVHHLDASPATQGHRSRMCGLLAHSSHDMNRQLVNASCHVLVSGLRRPWGMQRPAAQASHGAAWGRGAAPRHQRAPRCRVRSPLPNTAPQQPSRHGSAAELISMRTVQLARVATVVGTRQRQAPFT